MTKQGWRSKYRHMRRSKRKADLNIMRVVEQRNVWRSVATRLAEEVRSGSLNDRTRQEALDFYWRALKADNGGQVAKDRT